MKLSKRGLVLLLVLAGLLAAGGAGAGWVWYKRRSAAPRMTPEEAWQRGRELFDQRNFPAAYPALAFAAHKIPGGHVEAQWLSGQAALQIHRKDLAVLHFRQAWDLGRKTPETLLAIVDAGAHKTPEARLKAGLELAAQLPEGPGRKEIEGDLRLPDAPAEALAAWKEAFAAAPSAALSAKMGFALLALQKPGEIDALLGPLRSTPHLDEQGYALLALVRAERDDRAGAEALYAEGRRAFPAGEILRLNEGIYLLSESKPAEAAAVLDGLKARATDVGADLRRHAARLFLAFALAPGADGAARIGALEELAKGDAPWLEGERLWYRVLRGAGGREDVEKARKLLGAHPAVQWIYARSLAQAGKWAEAASAYREVTGLLARAPQLSLEAAQALHGAGKVEDAIEALRRLHRRRLHSKGSVELFRNLALRKGLEKEAAEAQAFLAEQYKGDPGVTLAGGLLALRAGNLAEASRAFDDLALKDPGNADAAAGRFMILLEKKDYEGVLRECAASKAAPALIARFKAVALVRLQRPDEAEAVLVQGLAAAPDWSLHLFLGNLLLARQQAPRAAAAYAEVLKVQPRNEVARLALATLASREARWKDVLEQLGPLVDAKLALPVAHLLAGEAELHLGRADRALGAAERALGLAPDLAGARLLQGAALLALGRAEPAEAVLAPLAAQRPHDPSVQIQLARARLARGDAPGALKGVEAAADRGAGKDPGLEQLRLVLLIQAGRDAEARERLRKLESALAPADHALIEAWLLQKENRLDEAARRVQPFAAQRGPALLWAELMIGQGRSEGVVEAVAAVHPDGAAWIRVAELARVKDLPALVVEGCRRALKSDPDNASLLNNLAWNLVRLPGFDEAEAVAAARKAAGLLPTHPSVLHTYGSVLLACRKERDCVDALLRAGAAVERSPKLMLLLSTAYEKLGDAPKAAQWTATCLAHPETAGVKDGELSRPALEERRKKLQGP